MLYGAKMAWRHVGSAPGQTALLIAGVAAAVFIFIFMSALIGGLAELLVNRTLGNQAHVTVAAPDRPLPLLVPAQGRHVLAARQASTSPSLGLAAPRAWEATLAAFPGVRVIAPILKVFAMITVVIGIASALMLTTFRRRGEIGIMRAFGATRRFILFVFVLEGALIGLAGGLAGALLAVAALSPFPPIEEVQPGQLPVDLGKGSIGLAIWLTTLGATLAALLPARAAARLDPVEAIQQ